MKALQIAATLAIAASVFAAKDASAQQATQTVTYQVSAVDQITISGPASLTVNSATAGSTLNSASASTTYAITTNGTGRKITAALDSNMPSGVTLTVQLGAPTNAAAPAEPVTLSMTAQDVVTGITQVNQSGLSITYGLSATLAAGVVSSANKQVTYTITAGA